jgi:hypothetical protein
MSFFDKMNDWADEVEKTAKAQAEKQLREATAKIEHLWVSKTPVQTKYEYLSVRFSLKGYGQTQELYWMTINGVGGVPWSLLPEMLEVMGNNGWTLVTHTTVSDPVILAGTAYGEHSATQHMTFSRPQS